MRPIIAISGLTPDLHDRIRREKGNAFAPNGRLIVKPVPKEGFSAQYADAIISEAYDFAIGLPEAEPLSFAMCCVRSRGQDISAFLQKFFPFALIKEIDPIDTSTATTNHKYNSVMNSYIEDLKRQARTLTEIAKVVKSKTEARNITPLLLPARNFTSSNFELVLQRLFNDLGVASDPASLLSEAAKEFFRHHPRVTPAGSQQSCFTDGVLHFKSPGHERHGFYRPKRNDGHEAECLLNARCRLGGSYAYNFHYDCTPARGGLATRYPNCHDALTPPKETYINIAPNDFIIGK